MHRAPVETRAAHAVADRAARDRIGGRGAPIAPEHVAGKLVEPDRYGERAMKHGCLQADIFGILFATLKRDNCLARLAADSRGVR